MFKINLKKSSGTSFLILGLLVGFILGLILSGFAKNYERRNRQAGQASQFLRCAEKIREGQYEDALKYLEMEIGWRLENCLRRKNFEDLNDHIKDVLWVGKFYFYNYGVENKPYVIEQIPWFPRFKGIYEFNLKYKSGKLEKAPEIEIAKWFGEAASLESLTGKVVLIDIWGTGCGPCVKGFPKLQSFYERYKDKGVEVIAIAWPNDNIEKIKNFIEKDGLTFRVGVDAGNTINKYGVQGIPSYYLIDKKGNLVWGPKHSLPDDGIIEELLK